MSDVLLRMKQDLDVRGLAKQTRSEYLRYARLFFGYHQHEPERLGEREIQQFLIHRLVDDRVSYATLKVSVAALRFLFANTLKRPDIALTIAYPKVKSALPDILSGTEIDSLLDALDEPKYRAIVMTTYGAGLRISEVCALRVADIDSKRMLLHVRGAKGGQDRFVPLPERVLFVLRRYWVACRPCGPELFPGKEPGHCISAGSAHRDRPDRAIVIASIGIVITVGAKRRRSWAVRGSSVHLDVPDSGVLLCGPFQLESERSDAARGRVQFIGRSQALVFFSTDLSA